MEFYYHMYGTHIGRLTVYRSSRSPSDPLFDRSGSQGNSWQKQQVETNVNRNERVGAECTS